MGAGRVQTPAYEPRKWLLNSAIPTGRPIQRDDHLAVLTCLSSHQNIQKSPPYAGFVVSDYSPLSNQLGYEA